MKHLPTTAVTAIIKSRFDSVLYRPKTYPNVVGLSVQVHLSKGE